MQEYNPKPRAPRRDAIERRQKIAILLAAGLTWREVGKRLGISHMTVCRHARLLPKFPRPHPKARRSA